MVTRQRIGALPTVQTQFWSFSITGLVHRVGIWSHPEITALPRRSVTALVACSTGTNPSGEAGFSIWRGIPLNRLLSTLQVAPSARFARLHCADGYASVVPLEQLDQAVLALERDSAALSLEDGLPARLIIPGCSGYKQCKWIERIEMIPVPTGGVWEERGAPIEGYLQPVSSFRSALEGRRLCLSGTAVALGEVHEVQLSIDEGGWMSVPTSEARMGDGGVTTVDWHIAWMPPHAGTFSVRLRVSPAQGGTVRPIVRNVIVP